jgi:alkanesulfonate monooxygenase SsuD/methylene tetrahydromethanopterin reductase-like flavin-dependent oxidoreductase (luciferase family)
MARQHAEAFLDVIRGEGFAEPNPRPMFPNPPGKLRVEPYSPGLRERIWWGAATNATAVWAAGLGMNLQSSTLKFDETGEPFHVQQANQIRAYREAWKAAGHKREPRVSVSRSIFALVDDRDRAYFGRGGKEQDQIGFIEENTRAIFGRGIADSTEQGVALVVLAPPVVRLARSARHVLHDDVADTVGKWLEAVAILEEMKRLRPPLEGGRRFGDHEPRHDRRQLVQAYLQKIEFAEEREAVIDLAQKAPLAFGPNLATCSRRAARRGIESPGSGEDLHRHPSAGATCFRIASMTCALYATPSWLGTVRSSVSASAMPSSSRSWAMSRSGSSA